MSSGPTKVDDQPLAAEIRVINGQAETLYRQLLWGEGGGWGCQHKIATCGQNVAAGLLVQQESILLYDGRR
jgi:hypothetical protein